MIDSLAREILVCPACRSTLHWSDGGADCPACHARYPVADGIPALRPIEARTIDPERLLLKSHAEAVASIRRIWKLDRGVIGGARSYYLVYALLAGFLAFGWWPGVAAILGLLLLDVVVFMVRRGGALAEWNANPNRIRTGADEAAVEELYARRGLSRPTMADWIRASLEAVRGRPARAPDAPGSSPEAGAADPPGGFDDERYREILAVCEGLPAVPRVVVDVGANDGYATAVIGIGRASRVFGIDISRQLLRRFRERLPAQTAVEAPGGTLPLKDGSVDFLFCTETLEHLPDPAAALVDFARVLAPGGVLMVQSPNAHRLRNLNLLHLAIGWLGLWNDRVLQKKTVHENSWYNGTTWHRDFSVRDYREMARRAGLTIRSLHSRDFFCPALLIRGRLDRYRASESLFRALPLLRWTGGDLVLVAEKVKPAGGSVS